MQSSDRTIVRALALLAACVCGACAVAADYEWVINVVDAEDDVGAHTSLAFLPNGQPAISYQDRANGDLKYAVRDGTTWQTVTVDSEGNVGGWTSLAVLPSGHPAISYCDFTNYDLKYASFDGAEWQTTTVDHGSVLWSTGKYTSLAILPSGHPAISYRDEIYLQYAWFDGSAWHTEVVESHPASTSLAFTAARYPAVAYFDYTDYDLQYAWFDGATWQSTTVADNGVVGRGASLAALPDGGMGIAYYRYSVYSSDALLRYARFNGATWTTSEVPGTLNVNSHLSLAVQPTGEPAIGGGGSSSGLYYHWSEGRIWDSTLVTDTLGPVKWVSLAFSPSGLPAISYFDRSNRELRYAFAAVVGDLNCDGAVDFYDIDPFVLALTSADEYDAAFPGCDRKLADCSGDGQVDFFDIDGFVELLARD